MKRLKTSSFSGRASLGPRSENIRCGNLKRFFELLKRFDPLILLQHVRITVLSRHRPSAFWRETKRLGQCLVFLLPRWLITFRNYRVRRPLRTPSDPTFGKSRIVISKNAPEVSGGRRQKFPSGTRHVIPWKSDRDTGVFRCSQQPVVKIATIGFWS